jgi:hypothetical protein
VPIFFFTWCDLTFPALPPPPPLLTTTELFAGAVVVDIVTVVGLGGESQGGKVSKEEAEAWSADGVTGLGVVAIFIVG